MIAAFSIESLQSDSTFGEFPPKSLLALFTYVMVAIQWYSMKPCENVLHFLNVQPARVFHSHSQTQRPVLKLLRIFCLANCYYFVQCAARLSHKVLVAV